MYANGQGVPQDHVEAEKWYRLAADQGYEHSDPADPASQTYGLMFFDTGGDVWRNHAGHLHAYRRSGSVVTWYFLVADDDHTSAKNRPKVYIKYIVDEIVG